MPRSAKWAWPRLPRHTLRATWLFFLAALAASPARGQGGPPLITDDPGTPGPGRWEINTAFTAERDQSAWLFETPLIDINYGVGERIQLKTEIPWVVQLSDSAPNRTTIGNTLVGVKWRFLGDDSNPLAISLYPQVEFNNSRYASRRGLADSGVQGFLPIEIIHPIGPVSLNLELGPNFRSAESHQMVFGLAAGYHASDKLELIGELHDVSARSFRDNEFLFNIGFRRQLTRMYSLLFAAGRSLPGSSNQEPRFVVYAGMQLNF